MSEHRARVEWKRNGEFSYETYSRSHSIAFDGDIRVPGAAAPGNVPKTAPHVPGVDPEQTFVASLSACHMLWFLHLACRAGLIVERYTDDAVGVMMKNAEGRVAITQVRLAPEVGFSGKIPSDEEHRRLHHEAHEKCFIANSVKSEVIVSPTIA
jgi:organic hydroperoxide reductase OsmC/OhrA